MHALVRAVAAIAVAALVAATPAAAAEFDDAYAAYAQGNHAAALDMFTGLAEAGDARAQHMLGLMYSEGEGTPEDPAAAAKWYRRAAEQGDIVAQLALGTMHVRGTGVEKNYVEGYKWLELVRLSGQKPYDEQAREVVDLIAQLMSEDEIDEATQRARAWAPQ